MPRPKKNLLPSLPAPDLSAEESSNENANSHEMKMREIRLDRIQEEVIQEIQTETDLHVLQQTMAQEKGGGKRLGILASLEARAAELRTHGDGAEGPDYDLPGYEAKHPDNTQNPLFPMREKGTPGNGKGNGGVHSFGDGANAKQVLSPEQRRTGILNSEEAKRRMNTPSELFRIVEILQNGAIVFPWGHIMQPQQEKKSPEGKILVHARPSIVYLKHCPSCGKVNRPEFGQFARCYNCNLEFRPHVKTEVEKRPDRYPGVLI